MDGAAPHTAEPTSNTTRPAMNRILLSNFLNRLQLEASVSDGSLNPRPHPHEESVGYPPQCVRHRYPRQVVHTTQAAHNTGLHNGDNRVVQCKKEHGRQQRHYHQQPGDRAHRSWCHLSADLAAIDLVNLRRRRIGLAFCHGLVFCVVNRAVKRKAWKQASYESGEVALNFCVPRAKLRSRGPERPARTSGRRAENKHSPAL